MARKFNTAIDLNLNEITNVLAQNLGSDPTGANGRFYYNTGDNSLRYYNGTTWVSLGTSSYTGENARDDIAAAIAAGTRTGITITYNDAGDSFDFTVTGVSAAAHTFAATDRLLGRDTAGGGAGEEIAVTGGIEFTGSGSIQTSAFTGDVTKTAGGTATTIANDAVSNTKLANMPANTIKGNNTGGAADPVDLTVAQVKTLLAYAAGEISFSPTGNIASTTVQAAIAELETDLTAIINSQIEGKKWKDPVDAATTGVLPNTPTYNSGAGTLTAGANAAFPTIDGVTAAAGQDYLVKDQASTFQNGIYTLTTLGSGAAPWVLTRRADASTNVELQDAAVMVEAGTANIGRVYTQTAAIADLTAAAQTWTLTNQNTIYAADGTTIELVGNSFRISATAAGAGLTGGGGSALAVGAGTGISVAADSVAIDTAVVVRKFTGTLTGGAASEVITHNLNTRGVVVRLYLSAGTFAEEEFDVEHTSVNTCTVRYSPGNIPAATYSYVVMG